MKPSPFKLALNYGAMSALAGFAVFLLLYWAGINPLGPASWLAVWIPPLFIVLATRKFRDHVRGGYITFGEAFITGFYTAASGAMLYSLMMYIFGTVIDPSILEQFKEMMLADLEKSEEMMRSMVGDAMYDQSIEEMKNTTLGRLAASDFFYKCLGGVIISLITAAILKRNPPASV